MLSAAEEGKKPPETRASPAWGKKSLPPRSCRAREAICVVHEQQAVSQAKWREQRSPDKWSCSVLQRKAKNPRGPVPICPGGKFLPDPSAGDRLFPEHLSKTCPLLPQAAHASQEMMPKPSSLSTWSHLRGFPE